MSRKVYLILIIIIGVISVAGYLFYNQSRGGLDSQEQACLDSGGKIEETNCCKSVGDFPDLCKIGACGCAPKDSHKVKTCNCGADKCFNGEKCVERTTGSEANFEKKGFLVKYGQEKKWALNYEEPGKPALVATLEFNEESKCDLAEGEKPCSEYESYGEVGDRIKVIGNKQDGVVKVDQLIYIR